MQKHIIWTDEEKKKLVELRNIYPKMTYQELAEEMTKEFGTLFTKDAIRHRFRMKRALQTEEEKIPYKEKHEILPDGTHKSDKLLWMNDEQKKDPHYLLRAHGYDIETWELVSSRNNIWNAYSKQDGILTLYSNKITVKPIVTGFDWDKVLKKIESVPPVKVKPKYKIVDKYLNLPLFDMHFGVSDYEYYIETQQEILRLLNKGFKEVLFIIGQDLLHNDDFRGRTASGREIERVNMEKAWEDAMLFYVPIIHLALEKSKKVKGIYSKGNHDESMSWAFVRTLEARFPQVSFDTKFKERKVHMLGTNFIGINHGDKKKQDNLTENFSTEFPIEWSQATTREIFTGHLHAERVVDKGGAVLRRMSTKNKIDGYHDDHGYTTAHKRFQIMEYVEDRLIDIHIV